MRFFMGIYTLFLRKRAKAHSAGNGENGLGVSFRIHQGDPAGVLLGQEEAVLMQLEIPGEIAGRL